MAPTTRSGPRACSTRRIWLGLAFALLAAIGPLTQVARAAPNTTLVVNTLTDSGIVNGNCTLREAIIAANTNAAVDACAPGVLGLDTIGFSVSGTITLVADLPPVTEDLTLFAPPSGLTISGDNSYLIMIVSSGTTLHLLNPTIANGSSAGGGAGIFNQGTLYIASTTFSGNNATSGSYGGAIYNSGTVSVINSIFSGNSATNGGGIYNAAGGLVNVTHSTFSSNGLSGYGGGINNADSATVNIMASTFSTNTSTFGGGIYNEGTVTVTDSTFSGNGVLGFSPYGGAIGNNGASVLNVTNSAFYGNQSGYGASIFAYGTANIVNSTFSGNVAQVVGGGIHQVSGVVTVTNSTFSGNSAVSAGAGSGVSAGPSTILRNTIVANSASGLNCYGTMTNGGNNIEDGTSCGWGSGSGSMSSTNPMLGSLGNNGGATQTHALQAGSPAIHAANVLICPASDQRGVYRLLDGKCDVGAYEAALKLFLPLILR